MDVGGKERGDTAHAAKHGRVVTVCDINERPLDEALEKYPDAEKFFDFRELLDQMGDKIDAVVVSTADHTHAPASIRAMRLGKHVYHQKPLPHTVWESRLMRETAREHGVCTQMGNQGSASSGLRRGVEPALSAEACLRDQPAWAEVVAPIFRASSRFGAREQAPSDIAAASRRTPD